MAGFRVLCLFYLFGVYLTTEASDGLHEEDVFDVLSKRLESDVVDIKRDVNGIEKRVKTIENLVTDMKDDGTSDSLIPGELKRQSKAIRKMLSTEKTILRQTVEQVQNKFSKLESDIKSQLPFMNNSDESSMENLKQTVVDLITKTNATLFQMNLEIQTMMNTIDGRMEEMSKESLWVMKDMEESIKAKFQIDVESAKSEFSARLNTEIAKLTEKMNTLERDQEILKSETSSGEDTDETKPAAHLMGSAWKHYQPPDSDREFAIMDWTSQGDLAFTNKVKYGYGRIVILVEGYYYVYSQLTFLEELDTRNTSDTAVQSVSHHLYRYNIVYPNGGEELLTENTITTCSCRDRFSGVYTSNLGAVFHLLLGDQVFVKATALSLIVNEPKLNYFGLFRIN